MDGGLNLGRSAGYWRAVLGPEWRFGSLAGPQGLGLLVGINVEVWTLKKDRILCSRTEPQYEGLGPRCRSEPRMHILSWMEVWARVESGPLVTCGSKARPQDHGMMV